MTRTIIQVWTHTCVNMPQTETDNFWGIGDMVRGTIRLYQLCRERGYRFIVDMQLHSIGKYLVNASHEYESLIREHRDNILFVHHPKEYIDRRNDEIIFFFTNDFYQNMDEDSIEFIQKLFTPTSELHGKITEYKKELEIDSVDYEVLHIRMGDDEMVRNQLSQHKLLETIARLKNPVYRNVILMTDSYQLRRMCNEQCPHIRVKNIQPKHIGKHENIEDSIVELFVMSDSAQINSESSYGWNSGYATVARLINAKRKLK